MQCKVCGKELKVGFGRKRVFCSEECRKAYYSKGEKFCTICGKKLTGTQRTYCSDECREIGTRAYREMQREKAKKPKAEVKPKRKRGRPKKIPSVADINAKARAEGLTYGQYCAKHMLY